MALPSACVRVGIVQMLVVADRATNHATASRLVTDAARRGASLIVLPECFTCLYGVQHFAAASELANTSGETYRFLSSLAKRLKIVLIGGSFPEQTNDKNNNNKIFNTSLLFGADGAFLGRFQKLHLFKIHTDQIQFDESEVLSAGSEPLVVDVSLPDTREAHNNNQNEKKKEGEDMQESRRVLTSEPSGKKSAASCPKAAASPCGSPSLSSRTEPPQDSATSAVVSTSLKNKAGASVLFHTLRIGMGICFDVRYPALALHYARRGTSLLCFPGAFNMVTGPKHWELAARSRAVDAQQFVVMASPARDVKAGYVAFGHSMVVNPMGDIVAQAGEGEEVLVATIDLNEVDAARRSLPILAGQRLVSWSSGHGDP